MQTITITQFDYDRLMKLLDSKKPHDEFDKALLTELQKGKIVKPEDVPPDVITLNSEVHFIDEDGKDLDYTLVFPEDANLSKGKISILSPIGCALLGYRIDDTVTIASPKGQRKLTVKAIVHQPEREGKFDL